MNMFQDSFMRSGKETGMVIHQERNSADRYNFRIAKYERHRGRARKIDLLFKGENSRHKKRSPWLVFSFSRMFVYDE